MTPLEIYDSFIIKANENGQTDNIAVEKAKFAILYNEASVKFVEWVLDKRNEDDIRYLAPISVPDKITEISGTTKHQLAPLPSDYLGFGNINAKATSECCVSVDMELYEIKVENENTILNDQHSKPSIEYREAPFYIKQGEIKILVDNFKIDEVDLMYYKYPKQIELNDPEDPESGFKDADEDMDFDKKAIDRIISIAVSDYNLNTNNPKFQADKSRVVSKF
tara:strand:- start:827 stop:1492 length:666 start_codon:yes stop_codon:yes gene_type:complete